MIKILIGIPLIFNSIVHAKDLRYQKFNLELNVLDIAPKFGSVRTLDCESKIATNIDPVGTMGKEVDAMADLIDKYQRCNIARELEKKQKIKSTEVTEFCEVAISNFENKMNELRANYKNRSGVGLYCTTENDNSVWGLMTKDIKDVGVDEGATAKHTCGFAIFLNNGGTIMTNLSSALFTDIVGVSSQGDADLQQRSLERIQLEGVYKWWHTNELQLGLGAYISQLKRGSDSFGSKTQNWWHQKTSSVIYEDVTPEELSRYSKFGGGIIGEAKFVSLDKAYQHLDVKLEHNARIEAGIEGGKFRGTASLNSNLETKIYPDQRNRGPYLKIMANPGVETITYGKKSNAALWIGGGAAVGLDLKGKNGGSFNFETGVSHSRNLLDKTEFTEEAVLEDKGLDDPTTFTRNRLKVWMGFKVIPGNKKNEQKRKLYVMTLKDSIQDLEDRYASEKDELMKEIINKEIRKLNNELRRVE